MSLTPRKYALITHLSGHFKTIQSHLMWVPRQGHFGALTFAVTSGGEGAVRGTTGIRNQQRTAASQRVEVQGVSGGCVWAEVESSVIEGKP